MKRVLIHPSVRHVYDIVEPGAEFPVATPLAWVDASDDVSSDWHWDGEQLTQPPAASLASLKVEAMARVKDARERWLRDTLTVAHLDTVWQAREDDVNRLGQALDSLLDPELADVLPPELLAEIPATIPWRDEADVTHQLTPFEAKGLKAMMLLAQRGVWFTSWAMRDAIEAASTAEAVAAAEVWPA